MPNDQLYILGPCSAETREQVLATAKAISDLRLQIADCRLIFRAGVWKPRTSPNTFQGAGDEGLKWLQEVKATYGIPVATEVATPEHVEKALEAGIDYLWIGARTSANPLAVQAIADGLQVTGYGLRGIFVKNPVNADAKLWLGNIERIEKAVKGLRVTGYGLPVMAIHRGCNHQPCWKMAHEVRLARPDIPMLLDPSHMSGDAAKVPVLMEKVAELGLDGAMIEVHNKPVSALSDQKQQVRPETLSTLINLNNPINPNVELNWLRAEIDELDEQLWDTIAARMEVSKRIGAWKKAHGVAPLQPERYQQIVERIQNTDRFTDRIQTDFALRLYNLIHEQSLRQQE